MIRKGKEKNLGRIGLISSLIMLITVVCIVSSFPRGLLAADKPIVLKAVTSFDRGNKAHKGIPAFIEMIEKESKGRLKIQWLGGSEVTKTFDQPEALRSGMIDMQLYSPTAYYKPILPVAEARGLSMLTGSEERKSGAFDLWKEVFRKYCNAEHLGFWATSFQFQVFTVDKISRLADFKGKTIRVQPLYLPFMKALGASPVMMPPDEVYSALEKKVIDGLIFLEMGVTAFGWEEVFKYMLFPTVFRGEATVAVNLDKFKSLPKDLQDILNASMEKMEVVGNNMLKEVLDQDREIMKKKGVQSVTLSPEEGKKFVEISQESTWAEIIQRSQDYGPKFKALTTK